MTQLSILQENICRFKHRFLGIRPMIQTLKKKSNLIGVEIGVSNGLNALNILKNLSINKLYLVDPYQAFYVFTQEDMDTLKNECHQRLDHYNNVEFIQKTSFNAFPSIPNVDFVYIDGNHAYEYVEKEINMYYKKVKNGGTIGGHDFDRQGVMHAVGEFVDKHDIPINFCLCDWWIKKENIHE